MDSYKVFQNGLQTFVETVLGEDYNTWLLNLDPANLKAAKEWEANGVEALGAKWEPKWEPNSEPGGC